MALTRDQKNAFCVHIGYLHFSINTLIRAIEGLQMAGCLTEEQAQGAIASFTKQREALCMAMGENMVGDEEIIPLMIEYRLLPSDQNAEAKTEFESLPVRGRAN